MDKETFDIIDRISKEHSHKEFSYMTKSDLVNEVWIICLEKLPDYHPSRGKLEHFLRVAVKNRLINRYKDITKTVRSPCPRCQYFRKGEKPDCAKFKFDKYLCRKFRNFELSNQSKDSLIKSSESKIERTFEDNILDKILGSEFKNIILPKISKSSKYDIDQIMSGGKISKQRVKKLKKEIFKILDEIESEKFTPLTIGQSKLEKKDATSNTKER